MCKKILSIATAVVIIGSLMGCAASPSRPAATALSGAYALEDGSLVFIAPSPRQKNALQYRMMNGTGGTLWQIAQGHYEGGAGWSERQPVANRMRFATGGVRGFTWEQADGGVRQARALDLAESIVNFQSGELKLRGKLVSPAGAGPFPAVVLVHGSGADSAVDHRFEPYMYAANGLAALVFDKRGTGESDGKYVQNFHVLADDVVAAVRWLRTREQIDLDNIHLAGFSQGGWVAPLAALKDGGVRSVLVGYGAMVPVTSEDRWGYVYALRRGGFGEDEIAAADRINAVIEDVLDRRLNRWSELKRMLRNARKQPWFETVKDSDSMLGFLAQTKLPLWMIRVRAWWHSGSDRDPPFIDRLYDPVPTMSALSTPSLWLLAGEDSSAPAQWTAAQLQKLQSAGRPIEYEIYPNAEHGILRFATDERGQRRHLGHEPDYFPRQIQWLRAHSLP